MKRVVSILTLLMLTFTLFALPTYADDDNSVNGVKVDINQTTGALTVVAGDDSTNTEKGWQTILDKYRGVIVGVSGVCTLTFLLLFILNFTKLGQSAGNPQMRSQAITGLIWTGIACAGCGGVTLFVGFFYNLLK